MAVCLVRHSENVLRHKTMINGFLHISAVASEYHEQLPYVIRAIVEVTVSYVKLPRLFSLAPSLWRVTFRTIARHSQQYDVMTATQQELLFPLIM